MGKGYVRRIRPNLFRKRRIVRVNDGAAVQVDGVEQLLFLGGLFHDALLGLAYGFEAHRTGAAFAERVG